MKGFAVYLILSESGSVFSVTPPVGRGRTPVDLPGVMCFYKKCASSGFSWQPVKAGGHNC